MAVKLTIDGIPFEMDEAAAAAVNKLVEARDKAVSASQTAATALAEADTKHAEAIAAKDKEFDQLRKDVMTPEQRDAMVEAWAKLIADAKRLFPEYESKGKNCDTIRREVITKLEEDAARKPLINAALAGLAVKDASSEAVKMAFAVLAAAAPADAKHTGDADPLAKAIKDDQGNKEAKPTGRDAYSQSVSDAWKTKPAKEQ